MQNLNKYNTPSHFPEFLPNDNLKIEIPNQIQDQQLLSVTSTLNTKATV